MIYSKKVVRKGEQRIILHITMDDSTIRFVQ